MSDIVERLRLDAEPTEGDMETAAQEIEKLREENERLASNARSDARLLAAYHKWCEMHGCAPSSSDLSKARVALGEKG
jgi:uncharacterized protein YigA (DUF484 family)